MRALAFIVALLFARASLGQNCDTGCPCGNACISCEDTCRVGAGTATGGSDEVVDQTGTFIFIGVMLGIAALSLAAVWYIESDPECLAPPKPRERNDDDDAKAGMASIDRCASEVCGSDFDCFSDVRRAGMRAPNLDEWLVARHCED